MKYKNIIWDWNGTLLNDLDLCIEAMNPMLEARGLHPITTDYYRQIFCFPVRSYYEKLGFDFNKEPFEGPAIEFMDNYKAIMNKATLTEGTMETLSFIKNNGYKQYILSAMENTLLKKMTTEAGLQPLLDGTYGISDDFAASKVYLGNNMVHELGLHPDECVMIGDSLHDAEVAQACGFACILFSGGHFSKERLVEAHLPIIDSLSQLKEYL